VPYQQPSTEILNLPEAINGRKHSKQYLYKFQMFARDCDHVFLK
jgi:hypothetical protein